jgi:hypothetical protein
LDGGPACRKASTYTQRATQTQNKHTQKSMPRVRFKPTIPVFEWEKTVHMLDSAATVIGIQIIIQYNPINAMISVTDVIR